MTVDEPRTHWAGVVIPPDKFDAWTPCHCGQHPPRLSAPVEPHEPTSGPDSTPRGSQEARAADGHTEALDLEAIEARAQAAYAEVVRLCSGPDAGQWRMRVPADATRDSDLLISAAIEDTQTLAARIRQLDADRVAYGDERAAQALRDAADDAEQNGEPLIAAWCRGCASSYRADEMGPRP